MPTPHTEESADRLARQLAGRFKIINITWIIISLFQITTVIGIVVAAWNLYVTYKRWRLPELIAARSPSAVAMFQGNEGWYISFFLINLVGGVVGAGLIAYEFLFVRGQVLKNRHLFTRGAKLA